MYSKNEPVNFEILEEDKSVQYGANLNQGHDMYLGDRVKLDVIEMTQLKKLIDQEINLIKIDAEPQQLHVTNSVKTTLLLSPNNSKLCKIPVMVENVAGRVLVKVGPCDLSGVGGHRLRGDIIKDLVNQALAAKGYVEKFENVNVSACVGVRGRLQMICGFFSNNREQPGSHMNAYIKTAGESKLTHWEPRQGPQNFFNNTICAMVTSITTSIFEQRIRQEKVNTSKQATKDILKHHSLVEIFDRLLKKNKNRITELVKDTKEFVVKTSI